MWNNGGNWNMWAMQPAAYSNIPQDQIDWASLAKQWIANREVIGMSPPVATGAPPQFPPIKPSPPMGHLGDMSAVVGGSMMAQPHPQTIICDMENSNSQDSSYFQTGGDLEQGTGEGWNNWKPGMPAWAVPPPPPPVEDFALENAAPESSYVGTSGQYATTSFGFNQSSEEMYSGPYEHAGYQPFWGQGPMPAQQMVAQKPFGPVHDTMEYRPPPKRGPRNWPPVNGVPPLLDESGIDAAKRRQLPLWIREGLEKMEREKQRQMEKEQMELAVKKAKEEADRDSPEGKVEITGPIKSIFDSDDEEKQNDEDDARRSPPPTEPPNRVVMAEQKKIPISDDEEEDEPQLSEEERQARMMLKVRQMLTEVLLEVTNREIEDVAHSIYNSAKRKQANAPARQLAKSTALASITSLGLGYGTEGSEDESDDQASASPNNSEDSDDEAALQERIRKKKAEFERKMRELEEKEKAKEMEKMKHMEEQSKSHKHVEVSDEPVRTPEIETGDDSRSGQENEVDNKRSKADNRSKNKSQSEKRSVDEEASRSRVTGSKQVKRSDEKEEESSSEAESESDSESSSSSESESTSSETSESDQKETRDMTKRQIKSCTSLHDDGKMNKEKGQNRRMGGEERRASWQESSKSRKELDGEKYKTEERQEGERKLGKKKRSRQSSESEDRGAERSEKRRHVSKSDDRYSRHPTEPKTKPRHTERTKDKDESQRHKDESQRHKNSSRSHKRHSRNQDWTDDDDRYDASYDFSTRTFEQDEWSSKSRPKKSNRSHSSHSSTERRSRRVRDKSPDRRKSTNRRMSSSGKDRDHRKSAKDRSGKKERAKHRSRSRSRSES